MRRSRVYQFEKEKQKKKNNTFKYRVLGSSGYDDVFRRVGERFVSIGILSSLYSRSEHRTYAGNKHTRRVPKTLARTRFEHYFGVRFWRSVGARESGGVVYLCEENRPDRGGWSLLWYALAETKM